MTTPACQQVVSSPSNLFSILSHNETLEMFAMAKDGLKISPCIIDKLDISPKAYYRALKQLKNAGLVEKRKDKAGMIMYFHTTFGSIIYQKLIIELTEIANNKEKFNPCLTQSLLMALILHQQKQIDKIKEKQNVEY